MDKELGSWLQSLELGKPATHLNMTVVPLFGPDAALDYVTLDEALAQGALHITEVSQAGQVPYLQVSNASEVAVLIMAGEEMVGAKQNRIANTSILVGGKTVLTVPVSCVEQGRWNWRGREFGSEGNLAGARMRSCVAEDVDTALKSGGGFRANQMRVWAEVDAEACRHSVHSPTSAMADIYRARRGSLDDYRAAFSPKEGQLGLVVLLGNRVAGIELFSRQGAFKKMHGKLIASYALDALAQPDDGETDLNMSEAARKFMGALAAAGASRTKSVGLGDALRLRGEGIIGAALEAAGTMVCLSAFPATKAGDQGCGKDIERASTRRDSLL